MNDGEGDEGGDDDGDDGDIDSAQESENMKVTERNRTGTPVQNRIGTLWSRTRQTFPLAAGSAGSGWELRSGEMWARPRGHFIN